MMSTGKKDGGLASDQVVHGVDKFLLSAHLAAKFVDIVYKKRIQFPVGLSEGSDLSRHEGLLEAAGICGATKVFDSPSRMAKFQGPRVPVQKSGFPQAVFSVDQDGLGFSWKFQSVSNCGRSVFVDSMIWVFLFCWQLQNSRYNRMA